MLRCFCVLFLVKLLKLNRNNVHSVHADMVQERRETTWRPFSMVRYFWSDVRFLSESTWFIRTVYYMHSLKLSGCYQMRYWGGDRSVYESRICWGMRFKLRCGNDCQIIFNCAVLLDLQLCISFLNHMLYNCSVLHCLLILKVFFLFFSYMYSYITVPYQISIHFHWRLYISILVRGMKSDSYSGETVLDSLWSSKAILCLSLHGWLIFLTPWPTWINSV